MPALDHKGGKIKKLNYYFKSCSMNKNKPRNTSEYAEQIYDKKELSYVPKGEVVRLKKIISLVGTQN